MGDKVKPKLYWAEMPVEAKSEDEPNPNASVLCLMVLWEDVKHLFETQP